MRMCVNGYMMNARRYVRYQVVCLHLHLNLACILTINPYLIQYVNYPENLGMMPHGDLVNLSEPLKVGKMVAWCILMYFSMGMICS